MLLGTQKINSKNHLEIGGCDVADLAAEFGTPLYVMDEHLIRANCREFKSAFQREYGRAGIAYASKAFCVTAMCSLAAQEGMWIDAASVGELHTATRAGFPADHVVFHGNFKSADDLKVGVENGVKYIVVDSFIELEMLGAIAEQAGKVQEILLRCNPGVDPHTHRLISTGQEDSKFGFNMRDGSAMAAVRLALATKSLKLAGTHCHLGSQLLDLTPYVEAADRIMSFLRDVRDETGVVIGVTNIGGGLGVRYLEEHRPPTIAEFAKTVSQAMISAVEKAGIEKPRLMVEPGRSIVAEAGTTIYSIGPIKEVNLAEEPGKRNYMSVDGGLSDNPRPALYDALYSAIIANKACDAPKVTYTVAGRHCETDWLIPSVTLPEGKTGDMLAVQTTGAYNHSMASNYNRFCRPAVVFVSDGHADVVARRESLDDLVNCDIMPERFRN